MEILYSDKKIAVCIKPVGMDSERDMPRLISEALGGEAFTVHRLDLNVGGVMVYARTRSAAAELSRCVQDGSMVKEYVAKVHGQLPAEGCWEDLLWKDATKNKVFVVKRERRGVKKARLEFRCTDFDGEYSVAQIRLHTGRSHQIRVQFASRSFPLVGDHKYGSRDEVTAPMLYSFRITFPYGGELRSFESFPEWAQS